MRDFIDSQKVLVVDDDPDVSACASMVLELEGFNVRVAADAFSAIKICQDWKPAAILLDLHLGNHQIQGTEVLWNLKNDPKLASTVVLIYTGCRDQDVRGYCLQDIGADGYLLKEQLSGPRLARALRFCLRRLKPVRVHHVDLGEGLFLDWSRGVINDKNFVLPLTPLEFNVFSYAVRRSPRFVSWDELARRFWSMKADYVFREPPVAVKACLMHLEHKLLGFNAPSLEIADLGVRWVFSAQFKIPTASAATRQ